MTQPTVYIVLASCEGERHVVEQVESLRAQSFSDWRLLVHDDLSTDGTPDLLRQLAANDDRIELLPSEHDRRLGPAGNFNHLLQAAYERDADAVFPCDQDDVWEPRKLDTLIELLAPATERPALAYSDLQVGDANLVVQHRSLMELEGVHHPEDDPLRALLARNVVAGCSCAVNRPLLEVALPIPAFVENFDWWLAISAAAAGTLRFSPATLVTYRQHGANVVGASDYRRLARRPLDSLTRLGAKHRALLSSNADAARVLAERLDDESSAVDSLETFSSIVGSSGGPLQRLARLRREGFWPSAWQDRLLLLVSLGRRSTTDG